MERDHSAFELFGLIMITKQKEHSSQAVRIIQRGMKPNQMSRQLQTSISPEYMKALFQYEGRTFSQKTMPDVTQQCSIILWSQQYGFVKPKIQLLTEFTIKMLL